MIMKGEKFENIAKDLIREEEDRKFLINDTITSEVSKKTKYKPFYLAGLTLVLCLICYLFYQKKITDNTNQETTIENLSQQLAAHYEFPILPRSRNNSIHSKYQDQIISGRYDQLEKELLQNKENLITSDQLILCHIWLKRGKFNEILNYLDSNVELTGQFKDEFLWVKFCALHEVGSSKKALDQALQELSNEYRLKADKVLK